MPFHYNPENVEVLRIQTEGVCAKLDELHERLRNRQLALDDLKQDYVRLYQPEAIALAEAMLHHIRDDAPRLMNVYWTGNVRHYVFDDMETIKAPLLENCQLGTIANMLRGLAACLPSVTLPA